ncbi:MAG: glycosyltransferase family 39 protein [Phycisphaerae bacterium]
MRGKLLAIIMLAALALRLGLLSVAFENPEGVFTPDSYGYVQLSDHLRSGWEFRPSGGALPEIFRTPGYPLFLLIGAPYGDEPVQSSGWRVVLPAQVLLDVLLVGLIYLLGKWTVSHRAGLAAAAFQATAPVAVAASCRMLSDSLYAFLLTAGLLLFVRHLRGKGHSRTLMACAAVMVAACYVRPVGLTIAAILLVVLLIRPHRLIRAGSFALVLVLALMPWLMRNFFEAGYVGFSSFAGDSAYAFSAPAVLAETEGIPPDEARRRLEQQQWERHREQAYERMETLRGLGTLQGSMAHWRSRRAREIMLAHPLTAARLHLTGCVGFYLPGATDVLEVAGVTSGGRGTLRVLRRDGPWAAGRNYFGGNTPAMLAGIGMGMVFAVKLAFAAGWCVRQVRRRATAVGWALFAVVAVCSLLGGVAATPRFRVPVEPLLNIAAGAAVVAAVEWFMRRRRA